MAAPNDGMGDGKGMMGDEYEEIREQVSTVL